jgi:hypothetical protein
MVMPRDNPSKPFYLVVTDHDRGVFAVEGPMTDDRPWQSAAREARNHQHRIVCGPGRWRQVCSRPRPGTSQSVAAKRRYI